MDDAGNSDVAVLEPETDVTENPGTELENVIDGNFFSELAHDYGALKPLIDAMVRARNDKKGLGLDQAIVEALAIIERFETMAAHGGRYTPPARLELSSENAATIAESLLGRKASSSSIRTKFAKFGK
jgi:hypothetical protein